MKKLGLLIMIFGLLSVAKVNAGNYKIDQNKVDDLFASSKDITESALADNYNVATSSLVAAKGGQSVGGYLIRAFFCGEFALHRYYMGASGAGIFFEYFCIPIVGPIDTFVDFWWVVFKGETALNKYKGTSKYIVWLG